jgi:kynurenine 3-monooxygenase
MVTFSNMSYSRAKALGAIQDKIMEEVMKLPDLDKNWENLDFQDIINRFNQHKLHYASV